MADLVYRSVMRDIKQKILDNEYPECDCRTNEA